MSKLTLAILLILILAACRRKEENPFWNNGLEIFEVQSIFDDERFPNVVVAKNGAVVATWGSHHLRVRRSEDGGVTWEPVISLASPAIQGGGTLVDESTGDLLVFAEERHPVAPIMVFRSSDHGKTWIADSITLIPDLLGNIPSMHMNERGITLQSGEFAGRLIRPTRVYGGGNEREYWDQHYANAIYSYDGGKTWYSSSPFPVMGTGEAAIEELSDGSLYYNSRRHRSTDGLNPRKRYAARSYDGGNTWQDMAVCEDLPDGSQHTDYGLMGGLVRLPVEGHDILLFSNIDVPLEAGDEEFPYEQRTSRRIRGTVWASFDGGASWPVKRLVEEGPFAYSSMVSGRQGSASEGFIYLLYESYRGAKIARFNLAWVTEGRDWRSFLPEKKRRDR